MRNHRVGRGKLGQAIVETALLFPVLIMLVLGSADLGRVFYYSVALTNAAREAARQGTYFDPVSNTNAFDTQAAVLLAAQREVPSDVTLTTPTISPANCLSGPPSSWSADYPTAPNTGWVFICFDGTNNQSTPAQTSIQVVILYNFAPVTPLAQFVGANTIQVEAATTMQVMGRS